MAKYNRPNSLYRPFMTGSPTEPKFFSRSEVLIRAGITSRQLRYYIEMGAVARPIGKTRSAKFTLNHIHQAQRVATLLKESEMTVAMIAEAYSSSTSGSRAIQTQKAPGDGSAVKLIRHNLTDGVCILVHEELLPTEKKLLSDLLKVGKQFHHLRVQLVLEKFSRK